MLERPFPIPVAAAQKRPPSAPEARSTPCTLSGPERSTVARSSPPGCRRDKRGCGGALSPAERTSPISLPQDTILSSPRGHLVLEGYYKKHDRVPIPMGTPKDTPKDTSREHDALTVASSSEVPSTPTQIPYP